MTARMSREEALERDLVAAHQVLNDLLAELHHPPEHLRWLCPSPWADWVASVRGKAACRRNQLADADPE